MGSSASVSGECGRKAFGSFEKLAFARGAARRVSPGTPDGGSATRAPDGHRSTEPGAVAWRRLAWLTDTDFGHAGPSPAQTVALSAAAPNAQPENARERPDRPTSALTGRAIMALGSSIAIGKRPSRCDSHTGLSASRPTSLTTVPAPLTAVIPMVAQEFSTYRTARHISVGETRP